MNAEACRRVRCGMASTKRYSRVGAQLGVHKRSAWMRGQTCRTCVAGLHTACNRHPSAVIALGGGGDAADAIPGGLTLPYYTEAGTECPHAAATPMMARA